MKISNMIERKINSDIVGYTPGKFDIIFILIILFIIVNIK